MPDTKQEMLPVPSLPREMDINPQVQQRADIKLHLDFRVRNFSSLGGTRMVADLFNILDMILFFDPAGEYVLKKIDESYQVLPEPPITRNTAGNVKAGSYLIDPVSPGTEIMERAVFAFTNAEVKSVEKETQHAKKKRRVEFGSSESLADSISFRGSMASMTTDLGSVMSLRDEGEYSFKNRLIHRDKGCVVCHAKGTPKDYHHEDHSRHFHGAHIFPFFMQEWWNRREHQKLIMDPYTSFDSFNAKRNKKDPRRINSLENGLLLCLEHHVMYDAFEYSINPATHEIYAFSSTASDVHGFKITRPWSLTMSDPRFPPPHPLILKDHFTTAIFENMKAAAEPKDDYDDDSDLDIADLEVNSVDDGCGDVMLWTEDKEQETILKSHLSELQTKDGVHDAQPAGQMNLY